MYQPYLIKHSYLGMFLPRRIKIGKQVYLVAPNLFARMTRVLRRYQFGFSKSLEHKQYYNDNVEINGANIIIKGALGLESSRNCNLAFEIYRNDKLCVSNSYSMVAAVGHCGFVRDSLPYMFRSGNKLIVLMQSSRRFVLELASYDIREINLQDHCDGMTSAVSTRRYLWGLETEEMGVKYKVDYCTHPWHRWKWVGLRNGREINFNDRSRPAKGYYRFVQVLEKDEKESADEIIVSSHGKELGVFIWDSQIEELAEELCEE